MDELPDPDQTEAIARAYLKQLRRHPREETQKPSVQAWLEVEERLLQGFGPKAKEIETPDTRRTATLQKTKKAQSIWKRPISQLWC